MNIYPKIGSLQGSSRLKFSYKAATEQFGPWELLDYTHMAEQADFDSAWTSDHFHSWLPEAFRGRFFLI